MFEITESSFEHHPHFIQIAFLEAPSINNWSCDQLNFKLEGGAICNDF